MNLPFICHISFQADRLKNSLKPWKSVSCLFLYKCMNGKETKMNKGSQIQSKSVPHCHRFNISTACIVRNSNTETHIPTSLSSKSSSQSYRSGWIIYNHFVSCHGLRYVTSAQPEYLTSEAWASSTNTHTQSGRRKYLRGTKARY